MNRAPLSLRPFIASDVHAGHALSQAAGWGHLPANWELMQKVGHGQLAIGSDGALQGVAMWWPYGPAFATLGMVIVAPEFQGRGIGRQLMVQILKDIGHRRIQLVATPAGRPLYESLGFKVTSEIASCNIDPGVIVAAAATTESVRALAPSDRAGILAMDAHASDADRDEMLTALMDFSNGYVAERNGSLVGYGLCHEWGKGHTIGPIVANDESIALALLSAAAADLNGLRHIDLLSDAARLISWLEGIGVQTSTRLNIMQRGEATPGSGAPRIFSLASQGLG